MQRLHPRTAFEGNGMGLAIARRIVERHAGQIDVQSQVGVGTRFEFTLPVVAESAEAGPKAEPAELDVDPETGEDPVTALAQGVAGDRLPGAF